MIMGFLCGFVIIFIILGIIGGIAELINYIEKYYKEQIAVIELSLPTKVSLPRKTKADKVIRLNLNSYRNLHCQVNNQAKKAFQKAVEPLLQGISINTPIHLKYLLYVPTKRKIDSSNVYCIVEKYFMDSLVNLGYIPDDDDTYIRTRVYYPSIYEKGRSECVVRIYEDGLNFVQ